MAAFINSNAGFEPVDAEGTPLTYAEAKEKACDALEQNKCVQFKDVTGARHTLLPNGLIVSETL